MAEPFTFASLIAGLTFAKVASEFTLNCITSTLESGATGAAKKVYSRLLTLGASGALPTNHNLERGLLCAAINATLSTLSPLKPDELASHISVEWRRQDLRGNFSRNWNQAIADLGKLSKSYRHEGWGKPDREVEVSKLLVKLKIRPPTLKIDQSMLRDAIAPVTGNSAIPAGVTPDCIGPLGEAMLEIFLQLTDLDSDVTETLSTLLKNKFTGQKSHFASYFPLHFVQELKEDPILQVILVHQRFDWNAQDVATLKDYLAQFRNEAQEQANSLQNQMLRYDAQLDELITQNARHSAILLRILSDTWLLDAANRATFQSMFRATSKKTEAGANPDSAQRFHFASEEDEFVGRELELAKIQDDFLSYPEEIKKPTDMFRWMVMSGEAGTGKSRLAQEIVRLNLGNFRNAGFASESLLNNLRFGHENLPRFQHPILIVVDYTVGHHGTMPQFMQGWADYARAALAQGGQPVRIIILLRRSDDRIIQDIVTPGGNRTDPLVAEAQYFTDLQRIDLKRLSDSETIRMMRARMAQTAARFDQQPHKISDTALLSHLKAFDPEKRPLFALMIAHALQREHLPTLNAQLSPEQARLALFSDYLQGQWRSYWRPRAALFSQRRPDDLVQLHVNLMRWMTACGGNPRKETLARLKALDGVEDSGSDILPSHLPQSEHRFYDQMAVAISGGRGDMKGSSVDPLPTLEPDLIGECLVLMSWEDFNADQDLWCEPQRVIDLAWSINPEKTAKFIRQMAQDYPQKMQSLNWLPVTQKGI